MLLTLTLTGPDAPVLGHLLHKHPDRVQTFTLPVGAATVFYPESTAERVTVALLLEIDPIAMVKRRLRSREGVSLTDYVTDRPYAASSMLAVALGRVFNTALNGRSDSHPEQAAAALPLEIRVPAVPARAARRAGSGPELVRRLFDPLGWAVDATERDFGPDGSWGAAPYLDVTLTGRVRLADALSHLYVLLPVLDNAKHYWVGSDEVAKLVRRGEGWLASHPERELIVRRYLASRRDYVEDATARLKALEDAVDDSEPEPDADGEAAAPLKLQRLQAVLDAVHEVGARRVAPARPGAAPGPAAGEAVAVAVVGDLSRRPAGRVRRDPAGRGDRAPRPGPGRRTGGERLRRGPSGACRADHPEPRSQRGVRVAGGSMAASGSPLRMDPGRVRRLGLRGRGAVRLPGGAARRR